MDEQKLTDWFPPEVSPARPGWYQREYRPRGQLRINAYLDYFDGEHWHYGAGDGWYPVPAPSNLRWRGLAVQP